MELATIQGENNEQRRNWSRIHRGRKSNSPLEKYRSGVNEGCKMRHEWSEEERRAGRQTLKKKKRKRNAQTPSNSITAWEKAIRDRIIVLVAGDSLHLFEVVWRKERIEIHTRKERRRAGDYSSAGTPALSVCQQFIVHSQPVGFLIETQARGDAWALPSQMFEKKLPCRDARHSTMWPSKPSIGRSVCCVVSAANTRYK